LRMRDVRLATGGGGLVARSVAGRSPGYDPEAFAGGVVLR